MSVESFVLSGAPSLAALLFIACLCWAFLRPRLIRVGNQYPDKNEIGASKGFEIPASQPNEEVLVQNRVRIQATGTKTCKVSVPNTHELKDDEKAPHSRTRSKGTGFKSNTRKGKTSAGNRRRANRGFHASRAELQQTSVKNDLLEGAHVCQSEIGTGMFTVGIPQAQIDILPERKSFRADCRFPPSQSTIRWPVYLCLKCRQEGHIMKQCPNKAYSESIDWTTARPVDTRAMEENANQHQESLCKRCQEMQINLHYCGNAIEEEWDHHYKYKDFEKYTNWTTLGRAASILFRTDCPLCQLLFSITRCPSDGNKEIILTPTTANRRLGASKYLLNNVFAACAYTTTKPTEANWNYFSQIDENNSDKAMSAIIYHFEDYQDYRSKSLPLAGRLVDQLSFNESIIKGWLKRCEEFHGSVCSPEYWKELQGIRLVDVVSRQIVPYPTDGRCDYIALSYVWGNVDQRSYSLGSYVGRVPRTIEDAMTVVKILGKKYLWVDSLTIDQSDSAHKEAQITLMSLIYRSAWGTIIALSGKSAESGLPRVNACQKIFPDIIFPQTCASLRGIRILSTMPTLEQQIELSPWATRAWTLQEGLLSPRCLYFTKHQVYFQCNTFQCCEALNDADSPLHNEDAPPSSTFGTGVLQSNFLRPSKKEIESDEEPNETCVERRPGLKKFYELLGIYSARKMTNSFDKLNAFSGILQALESRYFKTHGFHYGLPISELPFSLLWEGQGQIERHVEFPSWSWAGWETTQIGGRPPIIYLEKPFQPYLRIFKPENGSLVQIHFTSPVDDPDAKESVRLISPDPLWPLANADAEEPMFPKSLIQDVNASQLLYIEGIVLSFVCPTPAEVGSGAPVGWTRNWNMFTEFKLGEVECSFRYRLDLEDTFQKRANQLQSFLVLARDLYMDKLTYWLLLLDEVDGIAYRNDTILLGVPYHQNHCVEFANPRRTRIILG